MYKHRDRALKLFSSPHIISLIIFAFLRSSSCLTNPLSLTPSTHYGHSGSQQFPTNQYYNTTNTTISPLIYSITFPKPMADGAYKSGIAIQQINAQYHNSLFNITFYLYSKNRANLQFNIWSNTMHKIRTLTLRYMLFASNWLSSLTFYWFSQSGGPVSNTQTYSFTRSGLYSVNMTGTVKLFSCLTGFALSTTNPTNELSLIFSIERSSSTEIKGNLTSRSSQIMTVSQFSFNMIAYNEGQITAIPGRITLGTISANKGGTPLYTDINQIVRPYNTIFGLRGFYFKNEAFLSWKGTLTTNTSIQITSDNSFQYLQFIYMIIEVNWCIQATPYLMVATSICYDICPPRYYGNDDSWTCQPCVYDCYECLNPNNCTTCNITTDFREMNTTIMRCDPIDYYYDDGMNHATALPCDPNCLTCVSSNITCTSCAVGQFLAGSVCTKCMDHCANCSNSIDCIECENYFTFKQNLCSLNCTLMHSKCTTCQIKSNGQPQCLSCMAGYKLEKASCVFKSSSSESNSTNLLLILLPLLLGLLLCCLLILFCVWRRRKNEQNKVKEQNEGEIQNTDPNDGQIDENLNESKDVFDEKVVLRKKKYRGDNTKINLKSKKRRMPVVQDTEVNELSVQQFKEALKSMNQENGHQKLHTAANEASQSHALTLNSQNHQKMIEEAKNKQMPQKNVKQEKENSERASSRDDDSESNETKNNEDGDQADGRGR